MGHQELLSQRLGEVSFVPKEFAHQPFGQHRNGMPIIDIAGCEAICNNSPWSLTTRWSLKPKNQPTEVLA